jgi:hypothetical protein
MMPSFGLELSYVHLDFIKVRFAARSSVDTRMSFLITGFYDDQGRKKTPGFLWAS